MKKIISIVIAIAIALTALVQTISAASISAGDVNADNKVNLSDVSLILKHIAKWSGLNIYLDRADVTSDGNVNLSDASVILKYIAKWDNICLGHTYSNYKCTKCGEVDKAHAYEYLIAWVKENGVVDGSFVNFDYHLEDEHNSCYSLSYDANWNYLYISYSGFLNGVRDNFWFQSIHLDSYFYGFSFQDYKVLGYLDVSEFTSNSPITYYEYNGSPDERFHTVETARLHINALLHWFDWFLEAYDVGITIQDLGFKSYVV